MFKVMILLAVGASYLHMVSNLSHQAMVRANDLTATYQTVATNPDELANAAR